MTSAGEIDHEFAKMLAGKDPKTAVCQFCQRHCHRPVTKDDIVYTVQKYPTGFQATIKLNCIDGQEFAGEVAATQKEAEKLASNQVLAFYAETINTMPKIQAAKKKKRPAEAGVGLPAAKIPTPGLPGQAGVANPGLTAKSDLQSTCSKILRRVMGKGEVQYETHQVVGGFQTTVKMPGMPGEWGQQIWAGEVSAKKQESEQSAATMALEAIRADPSLMAQHNAPPKPKNWSPGQGKGKGKGKGNVSKGGPQAALQVGAQAAAQWNAAAAAMLGGGGFTGGGFSPAGFSGFGF